MKIIMDLWFTEEHTENVRFSIKVDKQICHLNSPYQRIDIFESPEFGRFLTLDGCIMVTENDEFMYHEMIVHVPMAVNPEIKNVLVIGAGDGGTVRELTRYDGIESIDMVEIDEEVVKVCKKYLPTIAGKLDDERVNIFYEDGLKFVRSKTNEYDLVIVDSTDPYGPGEGLFTKEFYGNCYKALKNDGILVNQHENPYYKIYSDTMIKTHKNIGSLFEIAKVYQFNLPTYPSGNWLFGFASKKYDPVLNLDADKWNSLDIKTRYYNTDIHKAAFALPNYVIDALDSSMRN